jgi:hypothetical protein
MAGLITQTANWGESIGGFGTELTTKNAVCRYFFYRINL